MCQCLPSSLLTTLLEDMEGSEITMAMPSPVAPGHLEMPADAEYLAHCSQRHRTAQEMSPSRSSPHSNYSNSNKYLSASEFSQGYLPLNISKISENQSTALSNILIVFLCNATTPEKISLLEMILEKNATGDSIDILFRAEGDHTFSRENVGTRKEKWYMEEKYSTYYKLIRNGKEFKYELNTNYFKLTDTQKIASLKFHKETFAKSRSKMTDTHYSSSRSSATSASSERKREGLKQSSSSKSIFPISHLDNKCFRSMVTLNELNYRLLSASTVGTSMYFGMKLLSEHHTGKRDFLLLTLKQDLAGLDLNDPDAIALGKADHISVRSVETSWRGKMSKLEPPLSRPILHSQRAIGRADSPQNDDAEENGDQGARAEPSRQEQGLGAAGLHVALAVAGTHSDGERARAALNRIIVVRNHHGQELLPCRKAIKESLLWGKRGGLSLTSVSVMLTVVVPDKPPIWPPITTSTTSPPKPSHAKLDFLSNLATSLIFSIIPVNSPSQPLASRSQ
ncbi:hypothetical protein Celaphus_00018093 [Cervus elaphus hippelaphus]|uniref:Uncharacterized protein n=1 Tax=Cervus elaphus hippelaphus TaxID=46360 RepID=A0A212C8G9_CEREH|nr:hypothetical protein Celaphus_00018093 [Cervus elaphus hippelaphus]